MVQLQWRMASAYSAMVLQFSSLYLYKRQSVTRVLNRKW